MDKLKEEILKITKETKCLTDGQLVRLLISHNVRLDRENFDDIYSFLKSNKIALRNPSGQSNTAGSKEYVLAK